MFEHQESGNGERGTLVWIGPSDLEICRPAFRFCAGHFPQLAVRNSLEHSLSFPAQHVSDLIVVRQDRNRPEGLEALKKLYPTARLWAMSAAECEGEQRTGSPWPGFQHFYWHQWNQVLPAWFSTTTYQCSRRQSIRIMASVHQAVESLASWLAGRGHAVVIQSPPHKISGASIESYNNFDTVIWDDTAAPPADYQAWRRRLRWAANVGQVSVKHVWICSFPRVEDWLAAQTAGVHALISKPYNLLAWNAIND